MLNNLLVLTGYKQEDLENVVLNDPNNWLYYDMPEDHINPFLKCQLTTLDYRKEL